MRVVALTADDLLRAIHLDTDTKSRGCSATLVRFDPARGVLDFATHCRDSKHTWRQRVRIQDWDLLLESVAEVDEEQEAEETKKPPETKAPVEEEQPPEEEEAVTETGKPTPTAAAARPAISSWQQARTDFPEIKEMDVKVSCNCPYHVFWGAGYIVDSLDAGDYSLPRYKNSPAPETRAPNIRDPGLDRTLCKHLIAVLRKFFV